VVMLAWSIWEEGEKMAENGSSYKLILEGKVS
jgi:hypothetical protein